MKIHVTLETLPNQGPARGLRQQLISKAYHQQLINIDGSYVRIIEVQEVDFA